MSSTESNALHDSVLGRAVALLDAFHHDEASASLSELTRRTGLPKATVHRMLGQLAVLQVVDRCADGSFRLGIKLFELGQRSALSQGLRETAKPILEDLRDATRETVHLAVLDRLKVLYVEKLVGHDCPAMPSRVGSRLPPSCTGVGKALLAYAPADVLAAVIAAGLPRRTPRSVVMPGLLVQELQRVRTEGVAYEHEESTPGIVCVACPVMGQDGHAVAAISISGYLTVTDTQRFAPAVGTAARALARQLAGSRGTPWQRPRSIV